MFKTTRNEIKKTYASIFCCGYCSAQNLENLLRLRRIAYNSGAYGWNYHVLEVTPDVCILTGYSGTFGVNIDGEELRELEKRADQAWGNKEETEKIRKDFQMFLLSKIMK